MDRGCLVCNLPRCVEDEQHFIFDCPAYNHIRVMHMNLFQYNNCCTVADFLSLCETKETVLHVDVTFYLYECTELIFCLLAPSWSPGH